MICVASGTATGLFIWIDDQCRYNGANILLRMAHKLSDKINCNSCAVFSAIAFELSLLMLLVVLAGVFGT
jgi:hypothetical protein